MAETKKPRPWFMLLQAHCALPLVSAADQPGSILPWYLRFVKVVTEHL